MPSHVALLRGINVGVAGELGRALEATLGVRSSLVVLSRAGLANHRQQPAAHPAAHPGDPRQAGHSHPRPQPMLWITVRHGRVLRISEQWVP